VDQRWDEMHFARDEQYARSCKNDGNQKPKAKKQSRSRQSFMKDAADRAAGDPSART
jgi:hypothetical protein